jgi:hypothetical protein
MPKSDSNHTTQHSTQTPERSSFKKFQQTLEDMVNISWSGNRTFDNMFGFILNTYLMASYLLETALNSHKSTSTADHKQDSRKPQQSSTKQTTESHDVTIKADKEQSTPSDPQQQMRTAYQQAHEKVSQDKHLGSKQPANVEILENPPKPQ